MLDLLNRIVDASPDTSAPFDLFAGDDLFSALARRRGIPIGNLTSQFFANLYLDDFDHWLKETLRVPAYLRYVDDLILLDNDKQLLWKYCEQVGDYLLGIRLRLHERKRQIFRTTEWVDVLGYRLSQTRRLLRNDNGYRFRRKLNRLAEGYARRRLNWEDINPSVQSWIGHACHAETKGLRKKLFYGVKFQRAHT